VFNDGIGFVTRSVCHISRPVLDVQDSIAVLE